MYSTLNGFLDVGIVWIKSAVEQLWTCKVVWWVMREQGAKERWGVGGSGRGVDISSRQRHIKWTVHSWEQKLV